MYELATNRFAWETSGSLGAHTLKDERAVDSWLVRLPIVRS